MNLGAYFFSDRVVLRISGAREVSAARPGPSRARRGARAARGNPQAEGLHHGPGAAERVRHGPQSAHGVVAVTTGILQLLDRRELRAVLAHEIATSRTATSSSRRSGGDGGGDRLRCPVAHVRGHVGGRRDDSGERGSGGAGLLLMLVAPLAATLVQLGISRSREYLADEAGANLSGEPESLARALRKLRALCGRDSGGRRSGDGQSLHRQPAHGRGAAGTAVLDAPIHRGPCCATARTRGHEAGRRVSASGGRVGQSGTIDVVMNARRPGGQAGTIDVVMNAQAAGWGRPAPARSRTMQREAGNSTLTASNGKMMPPPSARSSTRRSVVQ